MVSELQEQVKPKTVIRAGLLGHGDEADAHLAQVFVAAFPEIEKFVLRNRASLSAMVASAFLFLFFNSDAGKGRRLTAPLSFGHFSDFH